MSDMFSPEAVLVVFYTVFLSQIFLLSIYYPGKIIQRARYVLKHFPPAQYPKFYPAHHDGFTEEACKKLRIYKDVNTVIAVIGLMLLSAMISAGYQPDRLGGDEVFVLLYAISQAGPILYAELKERKHYRLMRKDFTSPRREADLNPRRLFNFISPVYVVAAVVFYVLWLIFFLSARGIDGPHAAGVYFSLAVITGTNLFYAAWIARLLSGKKLDPYKAYKDQLKQIGVAIKVLVFSSIAISVFLITSQAADQYNLEVFDPPLMSLYMQFAAVFGLGMSLKTQNIESMDFDVYKDDSAQSST
jgi:hypothetical protein